MGTRRNRLLNTLTRPEWKLVAYSNVRDPAVAMARPLKTAVGDRNSTWAVDFPAEIGSAAGLHAEIRPDSESKTNKAGPLPAAERTTNPPGGLNTCPVGLGPSTVEPRAPLTLT